MQHIILGLLTFNTFATCINYYRLLRINNYIDELENRRGNKMLNEINKNLDNMLKK